MKHIIRIHIERGETHYIAQGVDLPVVTQGKTLDELMDNLREAVALQLEGEDPADFGLASKPSVLVDLELSTEVMHA